mmetsp:Transcript_68676/g.164872  ORF Transcript_68676/g.164872 Transcript_68676/m.164872 type:complete len:433 (-) Transcript_68676:64-1362(-)|eukprot:CAMPEP_0178404578 /NCGR_PEP_ID=MMETSP0689_2-20121128/17959_1 /TAXON_ID=160604 /ORGANISM="Amphidinium massartii, Strain CS-259" /LENGTH=432 /DNA_ID=CAMNT_0020025573 /DNA_START=62 /DNA_END=1360 /DNA_ORIENTATION=+
MYRLLSAALLFGVPLAWAQDQTQALLQQVPDVSALQRMCAAVQNMVETTQEAAAQATGADAEQWLEAAKPVCTQVEKMTDKDMEAFLAQQKANYQKASEAAVMSRCKELKQAKGTPQLEWFEQQEWYDSLKELCEAIEQNPEQLPQMMAQIQEQASEELQEGAEEMQESMEDFLSPESMAKGCQMIEEGLTNGKIDWFEQTPWYPKAKALCEQMKEAAGEQTEDGDDDGDDEDEDEPSLAAVVSGICESLNEEGMQNLVQGDADWQEAAKKICEEIDGKSPEELQEFLAQNKDVLKKLGAMQVMEFCKKLAEMQTSPQFQGMSSQEWYKSISQVCEKVGGLDPEQVPDKMNEIATGKAVNMSEGIKKKCADLAMLTPEQEDEVSKQPWYPKVKEACDYLAQAKASASPVVTIPKEVKAVSKRLLRGSDEVFA